MVDLDARLGLATARVEALLLRTECVVRRDPPGIDDAILNEETGQLEPAEDDEPVLWTGKCAIQPANRVPDDAGSGRLGPVPSIPEGHYLGRFPMSAPLLEVNDVVEVTASRDAALVDRRFRVSKTSPADSFGVLRAVALEAL